MNEERKQRLVIYHGNCPDGFTAAWACWNKFGDADTEYWPKQYGYADEELPDVEGRDVVMVDCSYPREVLARWLGEVSSLVVLDHHKTAEADLKGLPGCHFDMKRSGAGMAWDYFFPHEPRPWLVSYIEDRDIWKWELPNAREIVSGIDLYERTFDNWTELAFGGHHLGFPSGEDAMADCLAAGKAVWAFTDIQVTRALSNQRDVTIAGYRVPCVNSCMFQSEIGNTLMLGEDPPPFAVIWFVRRNGTYKYSLRSIDERVDVSMVAEKFGGGGHRNAAAFVSDHFVDESTR